MTEQDLNTELDLFRAEKIVSWLATANKEQQEKFFATLLGLLSWQDCELLMRLLEEMQAPSGDESEPDEATARQAIETELAKLPERYKPIELTYANQRFSLCVDRGGIFRDKPAREAIKRAKDYVDEHERAGWKLPTGVVYGIYD